jgi:hypothetical protein
MLRPPLRKMTIPLLDATTEGTVDFHEWKSWVPHARANELVTTPQSAPST